MAKIKVLDESVKSSSVSSVVKVFESPEFGKVRTVIINDEPWFVGVDVASVLDYKYPRDAVKNLPDKLKLVVQMSDIQPVESNSTSDNLKGIKITLINESALYRMIMRSNTEKAEEFQDWVTSEVLPSIRKTGSYKIPEKISVPEVSSPKEFMEVSMIYLSALNKELRLSDASIAAYGNKCAKMVGVPELDYVLSKGVKFSATALLKQFGRKESINLFNAKMEELGYLATKQRKSTSSKSGFKNFKCLTEKGLEFGENMVSPHNEKETQPHYYENRFQELLDVLFGK